MQTRMRLWRTTGRTRSLIPVMYLYVPTLEIFTNSMHMRQVCDALLVTEFELSVLSIEDEEDLQVSQLRR